MTTRSFPPARPEHEPTDAGAQASTQDAPNDDSASREPEAGTPETPGPATQPPLPVPEPGAIAKPLGRFGHLTLQRRLLLALLGSLALICAVIGLLVNAGMRQTLATQLSEQLSFAADRAAAYSTTMGPNNKTSPLFAPGQASGTLNARTVPRLPDLRWLAGPKDR